MAFFKGRTFICLVLTALLVAGATMARPLLPIRDMDQTGLHHSVFWSLKKYEFKDANIIIMGSSCTYRGISPADMGRYLSGDLTILNFGFSAGTINPFMFAKANEIFIKGKEKCRAVLLEISPVVFHHSVAHYQKIQRYDTSHQMRLVFEPFNVKLIKTFFDKRKVHEYRHCYANGWMASTDIPPRPRRRWVKRRKRMPQQRRIVHEYAGLALDQVRKWRKQGVLVFGYRPYTPCMENWDYNFDFDWQAYRKRFVQAGGIWLAVDHQDLFCYDGIHLDEKSARLNSRRLGKAMANKLTELGWSRYVRHAALPNVHGDAAPMQ